jgi:hypothetical protein
MLLSAPPPWAELRIFHWTGLLPHLASACERLPALRNLRPNDALMVSLRS